jgi:nitric oxide dioxygenase
MLSHLAAAGAHLPVMLLHSDHDEESIALRHQVLADIAAIPGAAIYVWYHQGGTSRLPVAGDFSGEMDTSQVSLPDDAVYYLCGPIGFMQEVRSALIQNGVSPRDI